MQAEKEAKHESVFGSSPEPDGAAEDAYYARQQNGEWSSPDQDFDYGAYEDNWTVEPRSPSPDERQMSASEYFYAMQRQWHRRNNLPYSPPWEIDSD